MPTLDEVTSTIDELLDDVRSVSYQHLSRHLGLPCNAAKQALFDFLQRRPEACSAVYLLSGWTKARRTRSPCAAEAGARVRASLPATAHAPLCAPRSRPAATSAASSLTPGWRLPAKACRG